MVHLVWRRRLTRPTLRWGTLSLLLRRKEGLEGWKLFYYFLREK
jgi:hypothetical protein